MAFVFLLLVVSDIARCALDVPWTTTKYGPDGPWQAIRIKVGGYNTTLKIDAQSHPDVDMYPGGAYESFTFGQSACDAFPNSDCGKGGVWNPDPGAMSWSERYPGGWYSMLEDKMYDHSAGPINYTQRAITIGDITVWNVSLSHTLHGNITHFNGNTSGLQLGFFSLGAAQTTQTFDTGFTSGEAGLNVTANLFNGAAAFGYRGSLVFEGYNRGRVIGPITSLFKDEDKIDLLDIQIGVEYGASRFNFDRKSDLLVSDTGIVGTPQRVKIDPRTPDLWLPDNTCEGLASLLPIRLDATTKLYHWQVDDPSFKKIVTSPAYLAFVFPPGRGSATNITIKLPFTLLNLTLESPITEKPTQYFPCHSYTPSANDDFRLGRAFLQTAFIGRNWKSGTTWLSQAPGPGFGGQGLGSELIEIKDGDTTLSSWDSATTNYFNQSWAEHWSVVDSSKPSVSDGSNTAPNTKPASSGSSTGGDTDKLSVGAKAGIAVGVSAAALMGIGFCLLLRRLRRRNAGENDTTTPVVSANTQSGSNGEKFAAYSCLPQGSSSAQPHELHTDTTVDEMPEHRPVQ